MPIPKHLVEPLVEIIEEAEAGLIEEIRSGEVVDEPSITNRFLERVKTLLEVRGAGYEGIRFYAHTLGDRGNNSPEHRFGADFCVVLNVSLNGFDIRKGFLGQAKHESSWISVQGTSASNQELDRRASIQVRLRETSKLAQLQTQAWNMLRLTPASFVIVYSPRGFAVVPASSVKAIRRSSEIQGLSVGRFFRQFFACFVGDNAIQAANEDSLKRLAEENRVRTALLIGVREA